MRKSEKIMLVISIIGFILYVYEFIENHRLKSDVKAITMKRDSMVNVAEGYAKRIESLDNERFAFIDEIKSLKEESSKN